MIKRTPAQLGRWLPLTAIRADGLAALNDGRLLRAIRLEALAPLRMSVEQLEHTSRAVGELAAHLPDRQSLQLITNARPLDTEQLIDELHHQANDAHSALADDGLGERGLALERLALATGEGVLEHAQRRVAMQLEHLLVIPWHPARGTVRPGTITAPALATAIDELDAHTTSIVAHLQMLDLAPEPLPGLDLLALVDRHLNPGSEQLLDGDAVELLGELTTDRDQALDAAGRLRAALCRSHVTEQRGHLDVGESAVLCRTVSSVPDHTWLGWLLHLMRSPYPFTLSVHWQAGRRATERQRARQRYRRIWGVQRGREMRLKAPDPEASEREREAAELNRELTATAGAGVYQVAITLALTHPDGNAVELQRHARELERDLLARTDARLHHPVFAQMPAWRSTWPLSHDPLRITRKYVTANLADTTPLVAARCGSPSGIPLGWARPGRTLERLDPFDPVHENHLMVIAGKSGGGKTMSTNLILARILAQGASGGVIDRAGHYEFLASLIPGATCLNLGTRTGQAINPWDIDDLHAELAPEKLEYLLALHSFFLGRPLPDGTYDLEPRDHSQLSLAIRAVYRRCRLTGELPREVLLQEELYRRCEEARSDGNVELAGQLAQLAEGLHDYVGDGAGSYLADRPTSVPVDSPLVIFDTRDVGDARAGAAMFTIVEHLARRSHRTRKQHAHRGPWGGRTFLVVDEGWKMLERRSTGRWINEQARRSRHNRLFLIAISQSLQDFLRHPEGEALVSQSSIQLLLRQLDGQTTAVRQALGLTDEEAHTISTLRTVKGEHAEAFLCNGRRGRGLIEIHAGAAEYWIATSEPDHDQPLRQHVLAHEGGNPWAAIEQLAAHHQPEERQVNAGKPLIWALIALLLIPVVAIVAAVGLISQILGADSTACTALTTPGPISAGAGGSFLATAYGPPWNAMNGSGVTATGINLTAGQPALVIAVDPAVIPLRTFEHVDPNPFGTSQAFYAGDTGGAIIGRHVDIYDWQGRAAQYAWGARQVIVTAAPNPGTGPLLGEITPTAPTTAPASPTGCPVAVSGPLPITPGQQATILPDGLAAAPADAPPAVKAAIAAGNQLIDKPYIYGGGHGAPLTELAAGYDCSGSTSYILHAAGQLGLYALDSTGLESWGQPGPGRWITVYTNSAHVFIDVAGVVMDTAHYAPTTPAGSGPRWQPESIIGPQYAGDIADGNGGFVQRHPPGL